MFGLKNNIKENSKNSKLIQAREYFFVLTNVKPAVDGFRVIKGIESNGPMGPLVEMQGSKYSEVCFEAIPGGVYQLFVYLKRGDKKTFPLVSILMSMLSTTYTMSVAFYEKDTDPKSIKDNPEFWGLIPSDGRRVPVFLLIMNTSLMQVVSKTSSIVLLWSISGLLVVLYFVIDYGIFFGIKFYLNDFLYWVPIEGNSKYVVSFIMRIMGKLIVDFTGYLTNRHPYELGGAYYTFNAFMTQASAFPIAYLYSEYSIVKDKMPLSTLIQIFCCTFFVWFISFGLFLFLIDEKHRKTFFSLKTGCDVSKAYFLENEDDEHKALIFGCQQGQWSDIANDVEKWSHSRWVDWNATKPEYFTDNFIASVPDRYIPRPYLIELKRAAGGERRKSTIRNSILGKGGGSAVSPAPGVVDRDDDILAGVEEGGNT